MKLRDEIIGTIFILIWAILLALEVGTDWAKITIRRWILALKYWTYMVAMWISLRIPPM